MNRRFPLRLLLPLCFPMSAFAQSLPPPPMAVPSAPGVGSDEMDFSVKPVPQAHFDTPSANTNSTSQSGSSAVTVPPPPMTNGKNADKAFDQFFSTTTVLPTDPTPTLPKTPVVETKPQPIKKPVRKKAAYSPPYNYRTSQLTSPIYAKEYDKDNLHLPVAVTRGDLQTLAAVAVLRDNVESLRALAKAGANINQSTPGGEPLLVLAARNNRIETLRWLLQHGAPASSVDGSGLTALHYAAYNDNHVEANLLLQYGAMVNSTDAWGRTPLGLACQRGAQRVAGILQSFGANG